MRILYVITGLGMGGAERQVCDLIDALSVQGHDILLLSLTGVGVNKPLSGSVDVIELDMKKSFLSFIKSYIKAEAIISSFRPDVVHSHMVHANIFSRLLRLTAAIPRLICTAHNIDEGGGIRMLAYRVTDRLCDLTTNVSQEAVDQFISLRATPKNRIVAVHNGIDEIKFNFVELFRKEIRGSLGLNDSDKLILAVGRLHKQKDYPNLLNALSKVINMCDQNIRLVIIGEGEERESLQEMLIELKLEANVEFIGMRYDVNKWMSAADVFVLSSAWEGFGLVVAEAMACERVVVATDCGGVKEVVDDCGYLVPPNDSIKLSNALSQALKLTELQRNQLGNSARRRILAIYSLSSVSERWLNIYQCKSHLNNHNPCKDVN